MQSKIYLSVVIFLMLSSMFIRAQKYEESPALNQNRFYLKDFIGRQPSGEPAVKIIKQHDNRFRLTKANVKIIWERDTALMKYQYEYDKHGNVIKWISRVKTDSIWEDIRRSLKEYGDEGRLIYAVSGSWSRDSNAWLDMNRTAFYYDSSGNLSGYKSSYRDGENNELWRNGYGEQYEYDPGGKLIKIIYMASVYNVWHIGAENSFTYDGSGLLKNSLYYKTLYTFVHNEQNLISEIYARYWNYQKKEWEDKITHRGIGKYDNSGRLLSWHRETFRDSIWVKNCGGQEYAYDSEGRLTEELSIFCFKETEKSGKRYKYEYDSNGNMILFLTERYEKENWSPNEKELYDYDENGNCIRGRFFRWRDGRWNCENGSLYSPNKTVISIAPEWGGSLAEFESGSLPGFYFEAEYEE